MSDGQNSGLLSFMSVNGHSGFGPVSGDMKTGVLNSTGNSSGLSVGASSLVTDANSGLSGGPQFQRSASFNNESYMRLPASPMSFSSNNLSGSSVMDGSSVQQSPHQEQVQKQGTSSATSQLMAQYPGSSLYAQKRPNLDIKQEDILQQQVIQQLLQRQEALQPQGHQNLQLQAMLQHQRIAQSQQPQQIMQTFTPMQRGSITFPQQQTMRHHLRQQNVQPVTPAKLPFDNGICSRRLMQYLFHQRHRPPDNSILYWRKFVSEYFAPRAKKRWCLSLYDNIGNHALGVFPPSAMDAWHCDICGSKSGKGFEATVEVLPRLCQIGFDHAVVDENLFLDMPHECRLSSGIMVLEYAKAVQESVYDHLRVVRKGQLRIIFSPELKILNWEFCVQKHEEFLPRRLLAPQVNQLLHVAQKYQTAVSESGSAGVSLQDMQVSCNTFVAAHRQLARNLELQSLNDLGFSKRYVRCLQISEVVNTMKDLIDFSQEHKIGPIESLKNYTKQAAAKIQKQNMQESEQLVSALDFSADRNTLNKVIGMHPGINSQMNNDLAVFRVLNGSQQSSLALNNNQNIMRNSLMLNQKMHWHEALSTLNGAKQAQPRQFQGSASSIMTNTSVNNFSGQQQQQPLPQLNGCLVQQSNLQPSQVNQHLEQHVIQQMLQEMMNNRGAIHSPSISSANANMAAVNAIEGGTNGTPVRMDIGPIKSGLEMRNMPVNILKNTMGAQTISSNSFKSTGSNPTISGNSLSSRPDLSQNMDLPELDQIVQELVVNGMVDNEHPW